MATFTWTVLDSGSGKPVPNASVSGQYNSSPCPQNPWGGNTAGCSTGPGQPINGYTNSAGQLQWTIPYTCVGQYLLTVQANGYNARNWDYTSGSVTGDIGGATGTIYMTPASVSPPPGQGITAPLSQSTSSGLASAAYSASGVPGFLSNLGWQAAVGLAIAFALGLIILIVILVFYRGG